MKKLHCILIASMIGLSACKTLTPQQKTDIVNTASGVSKGIVLLAQAYQGIGSPGLPVQDRTTFNSISSYAAQLQPQVGTILNTAIIDSGSPAVNAAVASTLPAGSVVTQSTVNTLNAAAAIVQP